MSQRGVDEIVTRLGCETDDGAYCGAHQGLLATCLLRALATAEAERDKARELLRAEADQKWKEYDRANALSAEAGRLRAALEDREAILRRFRVTWRKWVKRDDCDEENLLAALYVDVRAALPPSQPPSGAGGQ